MSLLLWGRGCVATTGADVGEDKPLLPLLLLLLLGTSHENVALGPQPGDDGAVEAGDMESELEELDDVVEPVDVLRIMRFQVLRIDILMKSLFCFVEIFFFFFSV